MEQWSTLSGGAASFTTAKSVLTLLCDVGCKLLRCLNNWTEERVGLSGVMTTERKQDSGVIGFATSRNTVSYCASLHSYLPPLTTEGRLPVFPENPPTLLHFNPTPYTHAHKHAPPPNQSSLSRQLPLEWKVFQSTMPMLSMGALACHQCAVTSRWGAN